MNYRISAKSERYTEYQPHSHGYWEVLLNLEGIGIATIDGQNYDFEPGTIFCIRPGVLHSKTSVKGFRDWSVLIGDFCFEQEPENVHMFRDDESGSLLRLFELLAAFPDSTDNEIFADKFQQNLIDALQNLLCHWKCSVPVHPEVRRFCRLLADQAGNADFDLETAIASTAYSPNHFRKLFKDSCGCSPLQYLNHHRIQMAKELLLQRKESFTVQSIAEECGFRDPYYFSRMFRKETGVPPVLYFRRKQELEQDRLASDQNSRKEDGMIEQNSEYLSKI